MRLIYLIFIVILSFSLFYYFWTNGYNEFFEQQSVKKFYIKDGYTAKLVHDGVGEGAQHMAIYKNVVFVKLLKQNANKNTIIVLKPIYDKYVIIDEFCNFIGTSIQIVDNFLYTSGPNNIYRYEINPDDGLIINKNTPKLIVRGIQSTEKNDAPIFIINNNDLYVHNPSKTNACQPIIHDRKSGYKGEIPCTRLKLTSCLWKFDKNKTNQTLDMGELFSIGLRNIKSLVVKDDILYAVILGRDYLHDLYPKYYTKEQGYALASDELVKIERNSNFGFPYCYWDSSSGKRKLMPEYGGDGKIEENCNSLIDKPITVFDNHNGPNDLIRLNNVFYIAWNGKPNPLVCDDSCKQLRVDMFQIDEDFNFINYETLIQFTPDAETKPAGLAFINDKNLLITDSISGKIWMISKI